MPIARLSAVLLCLLAGALVEAHAHGKGKRGRKPPLPPQVALHNTLNTRRNEIQECAVKYALEQGADRADITTQVTINSAGQVVDSRTTVTVEGGDGDQVKACVDKVLRAIRFPRNDAPLIHIERTWTVAAQRE